MLHRRLTPCLIALILVFGACGGDPDRPDYPTKIPEANAEEPLPPGETRTTHQEGLPHFFQIQVPDGDNQVSATVQYSRTGFPETEFLSLSLIQENIDRPDFGQDLAASSESWDSEILTIWHVLPDSAGGRYYLAVFRGGGGSDPISDVDVEFTIVWQSGFVENN